MANAPKDKQDDIDSAFDIAAKRPLPNGLRLLALEFYVRCNRRPWRSTDFNEIDHCLRPYQHFLDTIGNTSLIEPNERTIFGQYDGVRIRLDIIGAPEVLQKWIGYPDANSQGWDIAAGLGLNQLLKCHLADDEDDEISRIMVTQPGESARLLDSLAHRYDEGIDEFDREFIFKNVAASDHSNFLSWVLAAQTTNKDFERLNILAEACDGDAQQMSAALDRAKDLEAKEPTSFLVRGLIPRGVVTLLLGNRKVGKSALALELAMAVAQREKLWAGFPLDPSIGHAVYLLGEDSIEETFARVKQMTGGETPPLLWLMQPSSLGEALEKLRDVRVSLLVVDPARKYFTGDEDGSDAVSGFFTAIETFCREKNAAAIVSHHLKKGAEPRNVSDVANHYRGSGVFLDRPRVTVALHRTGNETQMAIPMLNNAPLHNFSQAAMFSGVRRLLRDESTFRHRCIESGSDQPKNVRAANIDPVFEAASRILGSGERLTRTGRTGLHERKPPEIAGMARKAVRTAIDTLIGHGRLSVDDAGTVTLPPMGAPSVNLSDLIG